MAEESSSSPRHQLRRWCAVVVGPAAAAGLRHVHRRAVASEYAVGAWQLVRLRNSSPDEISPLRAHLGVERCAGGVHVSLSAQARAGTALVSPSSLPLADGSSDSLHAHGILDGTLCADAVLREMRRVLRNGGTIDVDVANAASGRSALRRRDLLGLLTRASAALGRRQPPERHLVRVEGTGRITPQVEVTHGELFELARAAGIEPLAADSKPRLDRLLARRIRLRGQALRQPRRPAQLWWPPLVPMGIPFEYLGPRPEVAALVPAGSRRVLDIGCAAGALGSLLESRGMRVTGVEIDVRLATFAKAAISTVLTGDALDVLQAAEGLDPDGYDAIIAADCLEHLADPGAVLALAVPHLVAGGAVIVSVPNVRHWDTLWNLGIRGIWPQRPFGIHDRTHLRWFTRRSIVELLEGAGLQVEVVEPVRRAREGRPSWLDGPAGLLRGAPGELVTFQWLVRARLAGSSSAPAVA